MYDNQILKYCRIIKVLQCTPLNHAKLHPGNDHSKFIAPYFNAAVCVNTCIFY